MASRSTIEQALHRLTAVVPYVDNFLSEDGLRAEQVFDLTHFQMDIPVKDGMAVYRSEPNPDSVYRDGYEFLAR